LFYCFWLTGRKCIANNINNENFFYLRLKANFAETVRNALFIAFPPLKKRFANEKNIQFV
jgi:hypothetical protein